MAHPWFFPIASVSHKQQGIDIPIPVTFSTAKWDLIVACWIGYEVQAGDMQ